MRRAPTFGAMVNADGPRIPDIGLGLAEYMFGIRIISPESLHNPPQVGLSAPTIRTPPQWQLPVTLTPSYPFYSESPMY